MGAAISVIASVDGIRGSFFSTTEIAGSFVLQSGASLAVLGAKTKGRFRVSAPLGHVNAILPTSPFAADSIVSDSPYDSCPPKAQFSLVENSGCALALLVGNTSLSIPVVAGTAYDIIILPGDSREMVISYDDAHSLSLTIRLNGTAIAMHQSDYLEIDIELNFRRFPVPPVVAGIEVTQATQYLWNPWDRDNSANLISDKPTVIRAYVQSGSGRVEVGLDGVLLVETLDGGLRPVRTLPSAQALNAASARAFDSIVNASRDDPRDSLIFLYMMPTLDPAKESFVRFTLYGRIANASFPDAAQFLGSAIVRPVAAPPPLHVHIVRLALNGKRTGLLPQQEKAATEALMVQGSRFFPTLPYPLGISIASDRSFTMSSDTYDVSSDHGLDSLCTYLDGLFDGIKIGILPLNNPSTRSWFRDTACVVTSDPTDLAHELAHILGVRHAPHIAGAAGCEPTMGPVDPYYYPEDGSIGDAGFDVEAFAYGIGGPSLDASAAVVPSRTPDFMTYCSEPMWIGPYHWYQLYAALLNPP